MLFYSLENKFQAQHQPCEANNTNTFSIFEALRQIIKQIKEISVYWNKDLAMQLINMTNTLTCVIKMLHNIK